MGDVLGASSLVEPRDDVLDLLGARALRDEDCIVGLDDDQVLGAESYDEPAIAPYIAA